MCFSPHSEGLQGRQGLQGRNGRDSSGGGSRRGACNVIISGCGVAGWRVGGQASGQAGVRRAGGRASNQLGRTGRNKSWHLLRKADGVDYVERVGL